MVEASGPQAEFRPITQKRIFVFCPSGLVTGGAELLHQLVSALVREKREAYVAYTPLNKTWSTPQEYERYACPVAQHVPDDADAAVVVPEVNTHVLFGFRKAHHVIWWLSVDNYRGALEIPAGWKMMLRRLFLSDIPSPGTASHLFQSEYARQFVRRRFKVGGAMLSDYLAVDYFSAASGGVTRRNVVAYNPRKGYGFTARLIQACPDIEFLRLEGMNREQMREAFDGCRVYIDFGIHPGKDRMPREAAVRGVVVIVGKRGAANYLEDVGLDDTYRLAPSRASVPAVKRLIQDVFSNYDLHHAAQEPYRRSISDEPDLFRQQVRGVFGSTARSSAP